MKPPLDRSGGGRKGVDEESELDVRGAFIAIGHVPNSQFAGDLISQRNRVQSPTFIAQHLAIVEALKPISLLYITLDLDGYQSGSLNKT